MRFSPVATLALFAALTDALAFPAPAPQAGGVNAVIPPSKNTKLTGQKTDKALVVKPAPEAPDSQALQKRAVIIAVGVIVGTAALTKLTEIAIEVASDTIKNLGEWNDAREAFTSKTTDEMWARNPDYTKFPAAVCYNKGYRLANPANVDGLVSMKFELGLLNTNYDCQFIQGPNSFFTDSEGGFINLSYTYNEDRCTFEQDTGDLICT